MSRYILLASRGNSFEVIPHSQTESKEEEAKKDHSISMILCKSTAGLIYLETYKGISRCTYRVFPGKNKRLVGTRSHLAYIVKVCISGKG